MPQQILGNVNGKKVSVNGELVDSIVGADGVSASLSGSTLSLSIPGVANKEDKFVGEPGQYMGFDKNGNPVAKDKPTDVTIYGFEVDDSENDPNNKITYIGDNDGYRSAKVDLITGVFDYGDWEDAWFIKNIKPVMLKYDGTVDYELNKNDYSKKASDGTASDIANDSYAGNVMVGIPTVWFKVENLSSTKHRVFVSNVQVSPEYKAYAHTVDMGQVKPYLYLAAYNGWVDGSGRMRSISGKNPTRSQGGDTQFTECAANNPSGYTGWTMETLAARNLINMLLLLIGKNTNTQKTFGEGNDDGYNTHATGSDSYGVLPTGTMNDKGLFYGTSTTNLGVKVFGIEHWWGNIWRRIAGYFNDNGVQKVKLTQSRYDGSGVDGYNLTGEGYIPLTDYGVAALSNNYTVNMNFNIFGLFVSKTGSPASATLGWCDYAWFNNDQLNMALFGGDSTNGVLCGAFACPLHATVANSYWGLGASPQHL